MGQYGGIVEGMSLFLAWAAIFVPCLTTGNRNLQRDVGIISLSFLLSYGLFSWAGMPYIYSIGMAMVILGVYMAVTYSRRLLAKMLPVYSLLFLMLTLWIPLQLHSIMHLMWITLVPGTMNGGRCIQLAVIDIFVMCIAVFLSVLLWVDFGKKGKPSNLMVRSICALGSTFLSGVVFYYTIPRHTGIGEAMFFDFMLIPGGIVVAVLTLVTCVIILALSARRLWRPHVQAGSPGLEDPAR
jgi:hypothetical protein